MRTGNEDRAADGVSAEGGGVRFDEVEDNDQEGEAVLDSEGGTAAEVSSESKAEFWRVFKEFCRVEGR